MIFLDETAIKLIGSVCILFLGFIISKIGNKIINKLYRKRFGFSLRKSPYSSLFSNIITTISIIITLFFLRIKVTEDFFYNAYYIIPNIFSFVLLIILIIIIVNTLMTVLEKILEKSGLTALIKEYDHGFMFSVTISSVKIMLYLMLGIFALTSIGIANTLSKTVGYVVYPVFIFILFVIFFGIKDFASNLFAGMYINSIQQFQIGQRLRYRNVIGTIEKKTNTSVIMSTDTGYSVMIPNKEFLNREVYFKEITTDIPTLEVLKENFVAQTQSYCGPASVSMILNIFGYHYSQEKIGELSGTEIGKGAHPLKLIDAVSALTNDKVRGVWIDIDKINDFREEVVSWLNDGALLIIDYKKNVLFPEAKSAHYSIVLAVEGDELVILDPSSKKGGVYLADVKMIEKGMDSFSNLIGGKRGYIIFAPKDSRAYNRLEKGFIYSDISLYARLNRKLRIEFSKMMEKTTFLEEILPKSVKEFIENYKKKEKISRVWRPKPRE